MTVYVTQPTGGKNFLPAEAFGDLVPILASDFNMSLETVRGLEIIDEKLRDYSDDDYLLLVGDPIVISACVVVAQFYNEAKVNVLKWDNQERRYIPVKLEF